MNLTPSQRAAIEQRGSNLLVAASAGSGKTEVLARRCLALLADTAHPGDIERLLVVTFTRAAAAELRVRIARMLAEEAAQTRAAARRQHLRRQELLVNTADIGTIDSWCGRLVREHFAEVGVDMGFRVLGAEDAALLRRTQREALRDWLHRSDEVAAQRAREWIARAPRPSDAFLLDLVDRLSAFREHLVNPEEWLARQRVQAAADDTPAVLAAALAEECAFQHAQLGLLWDGAAADGLELLSDYRARLAAWRDRLGDAAGLSGVVREIAAFEIARGRTARGQPPPEERVEVTEVRARWLKKRLQERWSVDAVQTLLRHGGIVGPLTLTLLDLEQRYHEMLAGAKRAQAEYEFGDIQRMALDLLGTPDGLRGRAATAVARRLQRRYEHVLVDEYQDTSPIQVELLRLVTRAAPADGNRFMVGDVKQSIYGFREAEPRLFAELIDAFASGRAAGRVQYLSDNFRSHAGVLGPLNRLFALLFDRALGGTGFGPDEALQAGRAELPNPTLDGAPRVAVHVIVAAQRGGAAPSGGPAEEGAAAAAEAEAQAEAERMEREAQLAAEQIRQLLADGVHVLERGADGAPRLRPLRLGDVVVLLRSAAQNAALVARVLRANGLRCVAGGRESLLDTLEVRDVVNVLKLLVNRQQDVPLAAYLRGPLVGLADRELLEIRQRAPAQAEFYAAVAGAAQRADETGRRVAAALAQLEAWSLAARENELPALVQGIVQEGALTEFALALPGGAQRVALLRSLQSLAAAFNRGGQGSAEFVAYLESLAAEEVDPGALASGEEDAVRIMTIHGAKGLEFPVVFLLGTGSKFNQRSQADALQCDDGAGLGLRYSDYPLRTQVASARHFVIRERVRRRELEEELRLLYVATTRARERLVIVGWSSAEQWDKVQSRAARRGAALPLISRMSASSRLEWVLMAAAAGGLHLAAPDVPAALTLQRHTPDAIVVSPPPAAARAARGIAAEWSPEDEAWIARGRTLLTATPDEQLGRLPAVLSVSAVKELAARERTAETVAVLGPAQNPDGSATSALGRPAFATGPRAVDGRTVGTACHRFLQFADLDRIADAAAVRRQCEDLAAARLLTPEEAALVVVEDVVWLASTAEGRLLAEGGAAVRREVPFVYALPLGATGAHAILRGVIDCLVATPAGLVILDYKTDIPRDAADLAARIRGYSVQLQLYAEAAAAVFRRPVVRVALVFLRWRQVVAVPLERVPVGAWLELVER